MNDVCNVQQLFIKWKYDHEWFLERDNWIPIDGVFGAKMQELFSSTVQVSWLRHFEQTEPTTYVQSHFQTPPHSWEGQAFNPTL